MQSAFESLGIAPRLIIPDDELRAAFRQAGKTSHPDAGGGEAEFAALREAYETLASPSRRLRHWLELRGIATDARGTVNPTLMDLFSTVGATTQRAEALVRKRSETQSVLALALLERETHACRHAVETALASVEAAIQRECATFPSLENTPDPAAAAETARSLAFLEKWRASLRALFARLV
jgi:curved DNA-binding protein CbpA